MGLLIPAGRGREARRHGRAGRVMLVNPRVELVGEHRSGHAGRIDLRHGGGRHSRELADKVVYVSTRLAESLERVDAEFGAHELFLEARVAVEGRVIVVEGSRHLRGEVVHERCIEQTGQTSVQSSAGEYEKTYAYPTGSKKGSEVRGA